MRKWMAVLLVAVLAFALAIPGIALAKSKKVFVSHPYTARQKYKVGADIATWGYVKPKASDLTTRTLDILVYARGAKGKYTLTATVAGTLFNVATKKHQTRYNATFSLDKVGRYRMRARYGWVGTDGLMKHRTGHYKYFRVKK